MRHNKKFNHLGRTASHRNAMLANMACSLIKHKRITTTVAKAKALKKFVEPLITKAKDDTTNSCLLYTSTSSYLVKFALKYVLSVSLNRIRVRVLSLLAKEFVEGLVNQLVLNNHLN